MKILITGACGFTGRYMIPVLNKKSNAELFFTDIQQCENGANWFTCDLSNYQQTYELLNAIKPSQIYHLAGSFINNYELGYNSNVVTTKNILDSIIELKLKCRVLLIGSAAEYGQITPHNNPVDESHPLNPVSINGLTKSFQTQLMQYYCTVFNLDIVMARPFNLLGKGISNSLFIGRLYEQIDKYNKRIIPRIVLGNLDHKRDYIDVVHAVEYYECIINRSLPGEIYNVGTGKPVAMHNILKEILNQHGLSMDIVDSNIQPVNNKIDIPDIYANIEKIKKIFKTESASQ